MWVVDEERGIHIWRRSFLLHALRSPPAFLPFRGLMTLFPHIALPDLVHPVFLCPLMCTLVSIHLYSLSLPTHLG